MGQQAHFVKLPFGIFAVSPDGSLLYYKLFSRQPEKAVEEYLSAKEADMKANVDSVLKESEGGYRLLRAKIREYAKSLGFADNDAQLNAFLASFSSILSKKRLVGMITRDKLIIQAANAHDDLHRMVNTLEERIYEWFSLHYPEVGNAKGIVAKIADFGRRENFPSFRYSVGADFSEEDEKTMKDFAASIKSLNKQKEDMESYVRRSMKEVAPNLSSLVDELLAARLISAAGSLEKMSKLPASAIQLLGAEKALFRHIKKQGRSPKYGMIYMSPYIQNARPDSKGKAARVLAAKLMQATRIDFYSGRFEPRLREELNEEMKKIQV